MLLFIKPYKRHICNAAFAIKSTMSKNLMYMYSEKKPDLPFKFDMYVTKL